MKLTRDPLSLGYVRLSPRPGESGVGMLAQPDTIRKYVAFKGLPPLHEPCYEDEDTQGKTPFGERPAGSALLADVRPGDHVIFWKPDRGFRNMIDFLQWFEVWSATNVNLHVIDFAGMSIDQKSNSGKLIFHIFAAIAEWERGLISERCLAVTNYLRSQGMWHSPRAIPLGFAPKKNPKGKGYYAVPDAHARAVMGQIHDWHFIDHKTYEVIAEHLNVHKAPLIGRLYWKKGVKRRWTWVYIRFLIGRETALRAQEQKGETA